MARKPKAAAAQAAADDFTPDAYVIRSCGADGSSHGDFKWPVTVGAIVTCPDWEPTPECGHGLHGLLDGIGDWSLVDGSAGRVWQVVGVIRSECVTIDDGKVKFPRGKIAYSGETPGAIGWIQPHMVTAIQSAATKSTTGYGTGNRSAAATTGDGSAAATIGNRSAAATTGDGSAAATTGYGSAAATTGDGSAAATTGDRSAAATTGDGSAAATTGKSAIAAALGKDGTASAADGEWIVLAAWDDDWNVLLVKAAQVGTDGIKPNTPYRLRANGDFEEVK